MKTTKMIFENHLPPLPVIPPIPPIPSPPNLPHPKCKCVGFCKTSGYKNVTKNYCGVCSYFPPPLPCCSRPDNCEHPARCKDIFAHKRFST